MPSSSSHVLTDGSRDETMRLFQDGQFGTVCVDASHDGPPPNPTATLRLPYAITRETHVVDRN
jgi:hypothetical protein